MEENLNFEETADKFGSLSTRAQATLMYQLIGRCTPMVLRTIIRYCCKRLDTINAALPDDDPNKYRYTTRRTDRGMIARNTITGEISVGNRGYKNMPVGHGVIVAPLSYPIPNQDQR